MILDTVSIIFPTHNSLALAVRCLQSITKIAYPKTKMQIMVIDNGSTDNTSNEIKLSYPKVNLISNATNNSFAKSINQGLKHTTGEYIFITNDDVQFEPNGISELVSFLKVHPETGIIGGKIRSWSTPRKSSSSGYMFNRWTGDTYVPSEKTDKVYEPDWIQGCALLIRRSVIDQIGLFDEHYPYFFEDLDLCVRAKRAGWKILYLPVPAIWHGGSITANRNKTLKYTNWYKSKIFFILKQLPLFNSIWLLLFQTFLVIPYRALVLRDDRLLPYIYGIKWNVFYWINEYKLRRFNIAA